MAPPLEKEKEIASMFIPNGKLTNTQLLLPVSLLAFIVFLFLAFQATQIVSDRMTLARALSLQEKPLQDAEKVKTQLNALTGGTVGLSQKGNKNAKAIVDRLKQMGVIPAEQQNLEVGKPVPGVAAPAAPAAEK